MVMKNCEPIEAQRRSVLDIHCFAKTLSIPFVPFPALAIERRPVEVWRSLKFSSSNLQRSRVKKHFSMASLQIDC